MALDKTVAEAGFEEKSFMEYHMYTLGRKSTINNNQVKQIEFIEPAEGVKAKKVYVYERSDYWNPRGGDQNKKVMVKIEFENKKENKLGIALPKGKIRVFKNDPADNSLQFVGEDEIDHTPKDEKLSLYIGDAFDIVAEHTLVENKENSANIGSRTKLSCETGRMRRLRFLWTRSSRDGFTGRLRNRRRTMRRKTHIRRDFR